MADYKPSVTLTGDREKELLIEPQPFMDRERSNIAKAQQGFITVLCLPLIEALTHLDPHLALISHNMRQNIEMLQTLESVDAKTILAMPLPQSLRGPWAAQPESCTQERERTVSFSTA
mmetsp:Transcript_61999/g.103070  ORF Transcript_61999/g.103070 Transcript_61999/m.103070 type:complete len:118 (+) Transcript_61999:37-390(+)